MFIKTYDDGTIMVVFIDSELEDIDIERVEYFPGKFSTHYLRMFLVNCNELDMMNGIYESLAANRELHNRGEPLGFIPS